MVCGVDRSALRPAVVVALVLELVVVREGIATYASLFRKWPATISCSDTGVPYVWPLLLIAVAIIASRKRRGDPHRLPDPTPPESCAYGAPGSPNEAIEDLKG